jgi:cysteine desulfurase
MNERRVHYFDNNATTRIAPEVFEAMRPFLTDLWGNASSGYRFGKQVASHMDAARAKVAALLNADPREIVFTSCGTESSNAALHSALLTQPGRRHVVTTAVEHSANMNFGAWLQRRGHEVAFLPVEPDGSLDLHRLEQAITPETAVVSVMWANNETGVLQPVEEIAAICHSRGALFHTDAVQVAGKLPMDVRAVDCDFLSLSAHKLHAPKGIGALYVKSGVKFQPYLIGGRQENGRRAGTENVPYIVGFGRAAELALATLPDKLTRIRALRDRMEQGILATVPDSIRNGPKEPRLPNTSNIAFEGVEAEAVLALLDLEGICASSGSACTTGSIHPSHVLTAMGVNPVRARGSVRFSLGHYNTAEDVDFLLAKLPSIIAKLRAVAANTPAPAKEQAAEHASEAVGV